MIDSTIIGAHRCAAAQKGTQNQGPSRLHGGFSTKIQLRVNAFVLPIAIVLTLGEAHDVRVARR